MRAYGGTTAKRTCLWSNSHSISKFETGTMKRKDLENADVKTTIRYKNKAGKTRFVGSSSLKSTQSYSQPGMFMTCCKSWSHYLWWLLRQYPRGFGMKLVYLHHRFVTEQKAALRDPKPVSWLCLFMFMCWCVLCVSHWSCCHTGLSDESPHCICWPGCHRCVGRLQNARCCCLFAWSERPSHAC